MQSPIWPKRRWKDKTKNNRNADRIALVEMYYAARFRQIIADQRNQEKNFGRIEPSKYGQARTRHGR